MRSVLLILMLVPFAGCLDAPTDDVVVEPEPAPMVAGIPTVNETVEVLETVNLTDLTEFYWAADGDIGDLAFELTIDFGSSNDCDVYSGVLGSSDEDGTRAVFYSSEGGWGASGGGALATVAVGPVDTRDVLSSSGMYGSVSGMGGSLDGEVTFTRVARNVHDIPELSDFLPHPLTVDITCEDTFDVVGARMGDVARVGSEQNLEGTIAYTFEGGAVFGKDSLDVPGEGHIRMGSFGEQAGFVTVFAPDEQATAMLPLDSELELMGDAGMYEIHVDRAAAYFEAFWYAMFGLTDDVELIPGIQDEASYESPF